METERVPPAIFTEENVIIFYLLYLAFVYFFPSVFRFFSCDHTQQRAKPEVCFNKKIKARDGLSGVRPLILLYCTYSSAQAC